MTDGTNTERKNKKSSVRHYEVDGDRRKVRQRLGSEAVVVGYLEGVKGDSLNLSCVCVVLNSGRRILN